MKNFYSLRKFVPSSKARKLSKILINSILAFSLPVFPLVAVVSEVQVPHDLKEREKFLADLRHALSDIREKLNELEKLIFGYNMQIFESFETAKRDVFRDRFNSSKGEAESRFYKVYVKSAGLFPPSWKFYTADKVLAGPQEFYSPEFPEIRQLINGIRALIFDYENTLAEYRVTGSDRSRGMLDRLERKGKELLKDE